MALQDILNAITTHTDELIAQHRTVHQKRVSELREVNERKIAAKKQDILQHKDERKKQMLVKAQTHAAMLIRNAELKKKQELLDRLYSGVSKKLSGLPKAKIEHMFKGLLAHIHAKGTLHPAKNHVDILKSITPKDIDIGEPMEAEGGFTFVSKTQEHDCTLGTLVHTKLRPETEVDAAHTLFSAS